MSKSTKQKPQYKDETSENDFSTDQEVKFRKQGIIGKKSPVAEKKDEPTKKRSNFQERTIYTLLMLGGFFTIIAAGPTYSVAFIIFISSLMFNELLNLKRRKEKEAEIPFNAIICWYFFAITIYFSLGKLVQHKLPQLIFTYTYIQYLSKYHTVICFMLWAMGFVMFTLNLKSGYYRYQIMQFGWTHIGCFFLATSTAVMMNNLYEGMIWFLLPATLVIANDIFAYIFGFFFGTHKLIALSPKKTWEGFIGGAVCSVIWSFLTSYTVTYVSQLVCPQRQFEYIPFTFNKCELPSYYNQSPTEVFGISFYMSEFNKHAMIMSLFASLIAPFGGFFASGLKRALKIKDFGDVIPGHGGLIDRFDCQLIMGLFAYVYIHSIILGSRDTLGALLQYINGLGFEDQASIYNHIGQNLQNAGIQL